MDDGRIGELSATALVMALATNAAARWGRPVVEVGDGGGSLLLLSSSSSLFWSLSTVSSSSSSEAAEESSSEEDGCVGAFAFVLALDAFLVKDAQDAWAF